MLLAQVREEVFKVIFRIPFTNDEEMTEQIELAMEELDNKSEENRARIRNKVEAILEKQAVIDETIEKNCEGWALNRIGKAEIAIMRIAVYEILFDDSVHEAVAINEAVELSKIYCDENAKSFINGVLGKVVRTAE